MSTFRSRTMRNLRPSGIFLCAYATMKIFELHKFDTFLNTQTQNLYSFYDRSPSETRSSVIIGHLERGGTNNLAGWCVWPWNSWAPFFFHFFSSMHADLSLQGCLAHSCDRISLKVRDFCDILHFRRICRQEIDRIFFFFYGLVTGHKYSEYELVTSFSKNRVKFIRKFTETAAHSLVENLQF